MQISPARKLSNWRALAWETSTSVTDKIYVNHVPGQDFVQKSSVLIVVLNKKPFFLLFLLKL